MSVKPRKNTVNPPTKVPDELRGPLSRSVCSIDSNSATAAASIDVVAVEARITNRRGRVVTLPQRFRG